MRALILGASGAVGSAIVRHASEAGAEVHAAVRATSETRRIEAVPAPRHLLELDDRGQVAELVAKLRPDWVLMAAFPARGPMAEGGLVRTMEGNVHGVLGGLGDAGFAGRLTWIGSALALRQLDRSCAGHYSMRGALKLEEGRLVARLACEQGIALTQLCLYTGFGPYEQPDRLLPALLRAALSGERVRLAEQGTRRDWIHFKDLAGLCLADAASRGDEVRAFDACSGEVHGARELASLLEEITGRTLVAPGDFQREEGCGDYEPGIPPSCAGLDWRPRFDLRAGLEDCWRWARSPSGRDWLLEKEPACA